MQKWFKIWLECVKVSSKFENEWFMFSTVGKLLQYSQISHRSMRHLRYISNKSSFYAASPSYLNSYVIFPSHQSRLFNSSHWIHFCFPIITHIIILYKEEKKQSKYKVKVPVFALMFKSFLCIVLYLSRRYFKRHIRNTIGTH